jgi:hypothetical protein
MNRIERFGVRKIETDKGQPRWQVVGRKPDGNRVRLRFETEEEALRHLAQSATYLYQDNPRYPTTCDTAYFGGILISMCI